MSFKLTPIVLFTEEHFQHCIVIPFPKNGKIVDTMVMDKTAFLIVQSPFDDPIESAHFHVIPPGVELFSDTFEYVGTFKIDNWNDIDFVIFPVIRVLNDGDFGIFSKEFVERFGTDVRDKILLEHKLGLQIKLEEITQKSETLIDEESLRKLWDFDVSGADKNDNDEPLTSESES